MSASRKLYMALAERLKSVGQQAGELDRYVWRQTVIACMFALKEDNSGFNKRRFLAASGFTEDELAARTDLL